MSIPSPIDVLALLQQAQQPTTPPELCRLAIKAAYKEIGRLHQATRDVAAAHVPDYHFLNYALPKSWLWECPTSPIGLCVYPIDDQGRCNRDGCIYCHGPEERK